MKYFSVLMLFVPMSLSAMDVDKGDPEGAAAACYYEACDYLRNDNFMERITLGKRSLASIFADPSFDEAACKQLMEQSDRAQQGAIFAGLIMTTLNEGKGTRRIHLTAQQYKGIGTHARKLRLSELRRLRNLLKTISLRLQRLKAVEDVASIMAGGIPSSAETFAKYSDLGYLTLQAMEAER